METKKLSLQEMEMVEGGSCKAAVVGLASSILGAAISFATLPVGGPASVWGLGVSLVGIYAGGPGMLIACDLL